MDERRRLKRQLKAFTEDSWDCSVCTYRNTAEAYKCEMCDVRKGTSTRKPRPNPELVQAQAAQQFVSLPVHTKRTEQSSSRHHSNKSKTGSSKKRPRLKNIDRSSAKQMEVTVGSVTVVITDYEPKKSTSRQTSSDNVSNMNSDSDNNSSVATNDHSKDMEDSDDDEKR